MNACCSPLRIESARLHAGAIGDSEPTRTAPSVTRPRTIPLSGGRFTMGSEDPESYPDDGEGPTRVVEVAPFALAPEAVTNEEFAAFVADTGHVTDAEREGWSFVFNALVHPAAGDFVLDAWVPSAPWWAAVANASWRAPEGPGSSVADRSRHPVVHVSVRDAEAFCAWAGVRLPSEEEWEFAARGGLEGARFPWGDELTPGGDHRCNIWQGEFPIVNDLADGWFGTAPVDTFEPNGYGLYNMVGNAWEICASPWDVHSAPQERVIRGGSYLCHASYCSRYRVSARSRTTHDSSTGNTGFRIAL